MGCGVNSLRSESSGYTLSTAMCNGEKLGSCGRSVREERHSANVTRRRSTPTVVSITTREPRARTNQLSGWN
eukprot:3233528-Prymnesium_polylepis.1